MKLVFQIIAIVLVLAVVAFGVWKALKARKADQGSSEKKISAWFIPINLIWILIFSVFGMLDANAGPPTLEKLLKPESIVIFGAPIAITLLFYWFFRKIHWGVGFIFTLVAGALMSIETIVQYRSGKIGDLVGEVIFTIMIWPVLIIFPYLFTRLADKAKVWKISIMIFLIAFLTIQVIRIYNAPDPKNETGQKNGQNSPSNKETSFEWPSKTAKTITAVPLDLTQIQSISKFRSCAGHDRSGYNFNRILETDSSMKHYVFPIPELRGTTDKVKMFAPFDGTVVMVQWVNPDGTEVKSDWLLKNGRKEYGQIQKVDNGGRKKSGYDINLVSLLDKNAVFGFRHVVFAKNFQIGDSVKAGEFIGYASVSEKSNDFDIDYVAREYKPEGDKRIEVLDSFFDHMTDSVLAEFTKFGITPENTKFTKEERDADPCGYDPQTKYGSTTCHESEGGMDGSGRSNDCWVQLKR